MKKLAKLTTAVIMLLFAFSWTSVQGQTELKRKEQQVTFTGGDVSVLKNEKYFMVLLKVDAMKMGNNNDSVPVYEKKKVEELNSRASGKGDYWLRKWEFDQTCFLTEFICGFNDMASGSMILKPDTVVNGEAKPAFIMVLTPSQLFDYVDVCHLLMHLKIATVSNPEKAVAEFDFVTAYSKFYDRGDKLDCHKRSAPGTFYESGEMLGRYFNKYLYKSKNKPAATVKNDD